MLKMSDVFEHNYNWTMKKLKEKNPYPKDESSLEYRQRLNQDRAIAREIAFGLERN
jgi:hypothetical protein